MYGDIDQNEHGLLTNNETTHINVYICAQEMLVAFNVVDTQL